MICNYSFKINESKRFVCDIIEVDKDIHVPILVEYTICIINMSIGGIIALFLLEHLTSSLMFNSIRYSVDLVMQVGYALYKV